MAALEALAALVAAALESSPSDPPVDSATGLPGRRRFVERLAVLGCEPVWKRTWGAVAALEIEGAERLDDRTGKGLAGHALRAFAKSLGASLHGEAELYALDAPGFALLCGVGANFDAARIAGAIEKAEAAVRAAGFNDLHARFGIATYDERPTPADAYRLADWRAYAEKANLR